MTQGIEIATQIQQLLARDTDALAENEQALLVGFYCEKGQPSRNFSAGYLHHLLSHAGQLTAEQRADLLAFRAAVNMKAQGMLASIEI